MKSLHLPDAEKSPPRPVETTGPQSSPISGERRGSRDAGPKTASTPAAMPLAPVVSIFDARLRRVLAMLLDEEPLDQEAEKRAWNDREPGAV